MNDAQLVLTATQTLLADEKNWCKLAPARDRSGNLVATPASKDAFAFCLLAGLGKAADALGLGANDARQFLTLAIMEITGLDEMRVSILGFNDDHDHATVMRALARAIELARGEAAAA